MAKLSDKQMNGLVLGIGGVVALLFGYFIYSDYDTIEQLRTQHVGVQKEIDGAELKKRELAPLTESLYVKEKQYEYFKKALPEEKDFIAFYETLERFRLEKAIKPWISFRIKDNVTEGKEGEQKPDSQTDAKGKTPVTSGTAVAAEFTETDYIASVILTFDQLLQLLHQIENYDRFYGIKRIQIPPITIGKDGIISDDPETTVQLELVSFSYNGKTPLDLEIQKIIGPDIFVPSPALLAKVKKLEQDEWGKGEQSERPPLVRNPFKPVLTKIRIEQVDKPDITIGPPPEPEQLKSDLDRLAEVRNYLHMLAVAESWIELQNAIKEKKYKSSLSAMQFTTKNDPDKEFQGKVDQMRKELTEWEKLISDAQRQEKAQQLVIMGKKKIKDMEDLYNEGKQKGSQKILEKVREIYNETMPQFQEFSDFESKIPDLEALRKKTQDIYARAEIQVKIIQLADKLNLEGIIYMDKSPELSVAFINKKVVRRNDILMMGFVVHEIQEQGVVLKYKEETVPIRLKRTARVNPGVSKSS